MSGMNLGTLLVKMNAETKALAKGMRDGLREVQEAAKAMKRLGAEVATAGAAVTGFFAGMVKAAAAVDFGVKKSVDRLKDSFLTLAVQVAHMVMPAIQQLSQLLRDLANWFAGLPSSTKRAISDFALFAVKAGAVGIALSKVSGLVSGLMGLFSGFAGVVASIGAGPVALLLAGITALLVAVAVLHKAWRQNWGGIRDSSKQVIETISQWWVKFRDFLSDLWVDVVDGVRRAILKMLSLWEQTQVALGRDPEKAAKGRQAGELAVNEAASAVSTPGKAKALVLEAAAAVKAAGLDVAKELVLVAKEVRNALGLTSSGGAAPGQSSSKVGQGGAVERYSDAVENAIKHSLDKPQRVNSMPGLRGGTDVRAAAEGFWEGMEGLGPIGAGIAGSVQQFALDLKDAFQAGMQQLGGALKFGGELMLTKMGELGQVIQTGIQGFQSGGIWGAIIGVFIELLSRFERFQEIIDIGNGQMKQFIDMLSDAFNPIIDALRTFMGASGYLTEVVITLLTPIFEQLGRAIEGFVPLIMAVAEALALFQPIFEFIGEILGPIFDLLGYIMRFVGLTILGTMNGLLLLWQGVLHVVNAIVKAVTGGQGGKDLDRMLEENQTRINETQAKMKRLAETGMVEVAKAAADTSEEIGKMGEAAEEASHQLQLLNVPEGYKDTFARFASIAMSSSGGGFGTLDAGTERRQLYLSTGNSSRSRFFTKRK